MRYRWIPLLLLPLLLTPGAARATIVKVLSVDELAAASDLVIDGTVTRTEVHWTPDRRGIYTDIEIQLADAIDVTPKKRDLKKGGTVTIRQAGGERDGMGFRVIGAPEFAPGERVVLFLQEIQGLRIVVGLKQGKLPVEKDPKTGELKARRDLSGLGIAEDTGVHKHAGDEPGDTIPLADLKQRVQEAADARQATEEQ